MNHAIVTRTETLGWSVKASGSNDIELLHYVIPVENLTSAAQKAISISKLMLGYQYDESSYLQLSLRGWQVEIIMSAPTGTWWAAAQRDFAAAVSDTFKDSLITST